jgi:translation initiation factor 3 subunit C
MEYVERLKDESSLYSVLLLSQQWFELVSATESTARIILRRVEHVYSKPDAVVLYLEQTARAAFPDLTSSIIPETQNISQLVHSLCIYLYRSADSLLRTRAMLSHIYHHALNGRYHEARDMLLMSHLQGAISHADQGSQILYNRAIVQLGLSAFRRGLVTETRTILLEIFTSQRPKELLAQGFPQQKFSQSTPEQERADKLRTLPFHMHINLELAEAAFLVSCMLYEIPMLAKGHEDESGRNLPSRPFKKLLDQADRQTFMGAPETTRNCIEQASKALQNADWEGCRDLILQIKIWTLLPDAQGVQDMITRKIQEEGLRTYLNTFAPFYTTLSLALLSKTFSLPVKSVTSIVSKMIHNAALPASLDQIDQVVVFYRVEQTRTQSLAQTLAEKVRSLNESNQKALEIKLGTAGGERGGDGRERGEGGGNAGGQRRGGAGRGRGGRGRGAGRGAFTGQLGNQRRAGQTA